MSRTPTLADARPASEDTMEQWEPESPFVDRLVVGEATHDRSHPRPPAASPYMTESPFLSLYETAADVDYPSVQARELYGILAELRDAEFDAAVYQLQAEAYDLLAPRVEGEEDVTDYEIEQFFSAHFGPLVRETGRLLDGMAAEMERRDVDAITEHELDDLLSGFEPHDTGLSPAFEGFLKKVWKKAKTAVKKVASAAKKGIVKAVKTVGKIASAPIAIVLKKLKALVKPLLEKVLKSAIGKLPEPLQDAAKQAAQKLFGDKAKTAEVDSELGDMELEMVALETDGIDATDDEVTFLQTEFDLQLANLMLADNETTQDIALADYETRARRLGTAPHIRLRRARRRFVHNVQTLRDGDDPAPVVEQFIPAILPVLKLGLKIIGRKRVVGAIGKLVGNLLRPFTGPKMSTPLANAIVDTGLKIIGFEMTEDNKATIAAEATASVVEDTVRRVAQLPSDVLDNEIFLEAAVEEAFDKALSQNFPPMPRRPELVSSELPGAWARRGEYERFEPETPIVVTITQKMANDLKTFGGGTPTVLGRSLKELVGRNARVRIYKAIPGTWLSKITRDEKDVKGLGGIDEVQWRSLHPLDFTAASLLTRDPSMAGTMLIDPKFLQSPHTITPGQRFYYLEMEGIDPPERILHESAFYYVLDCPQRFSSITFYLGELEAQEIAKHLRVGNLTLAGKELGKVWLRIAIRAITNGLGETVDIRKETVEIDRILPALARLAPVILAGLRWLIVRLGPPIAKWLLTKAIADQFLKLADDPQDGVTFKLMWRDPAGLDIVCRLLSSQSVSPKDFAKEFQEFLSKHINNLPVPTIQAGYHRD
jgi:hypothetical protein